MRSKRSALAAAAVASLALAGTALSQSHDSATSAAAGTNTPASTQSSRQWHRFRGRVTQANSAHHWFRTNEVASPAAVVAAKLAPWSSGTRTLLIRA